MTAQRILVVGYLSVDTVTDTLGNVSCQPGGAALYAALGARRAGAAVDIAASVGEDYPAAWLAALEADGIGLRDLDRKAIRSRWATIRHHADGRRQSLHYDDPAWWRSSEAHAPRGPADLSPYGRIVACPMPMGRLQGLVSDTRRAGIPIVADTNEAFAKTDGPVILDLLPGLEIFAPSREETRLLCPGVDDDDAARFLAARGTDIVQKRGADGAFVVAAGGADERHQPARIARAIDPTGAGDATVGALTAGRLAGLDLWACVDAALAVGAITVSGLGPNALCPAFQDIAPTGAANGACRR